MRDRLGRWNVSKCGQRGSWREPTNRWPHREQQCSNCIPIDTMIIPVESIGASHEKIGNLLFALADEIIVAWDDGSRSREQD
jgi:hypothetical protein